MSSDCLLMLDGNWLVHRAYSVAKNAKQPAMVPHIVADYVLRWCLRYSTQHNATHLFIAFDGRRCFRHDVYPYYKANRRQVLAPDGDRFMTREELCAAIDTGAPINEPVDAVAVAGDTTRTLLADWNVPMIHHQLYEADDWLSSGAQLVKRMGNSGDSIRGVMGTKDKDALQSINPHVVQWWPGQSKEPDVTITHRDLSPRLAKYVHADAAEWTPNQFLDYQILVGDSLDDVPPIVKPAQARSIINTHGSLFRFFKTREGDSFYAKNVTQLLRNMRLVRMAVDLLCPDDVKSFALTHVRKPKDAPVSTVNEYAKFVAWRDSSRAKGLF